MKNYKQILEAINRGILFALDDFDDEEPIKNIKSKQVLNRDYTKEYLDLMKEVVDLGLPSRTLWCKYNLGVNPNQLTKPEDWYGKYYAWGELEGNKTKYGHIYFSWSNYKFGNIYNHESTKYCNNSKFGLNGFIDNLTLLLPEDDVAYQKKKLHNFKFHIPTKEQCEELKNYTTNYWIYNYDPNKIKHNSEDDGGIKGLNGRVFEGKNTNLLFIPAAGFCDDDRRYNIGTGGYLWSSSLYLDSLVGGPSDAYSLYFRSRNTYVRSHHIGIGGYDRNRGFDIRPVINL